jgi:hypothetical protein
MDDPVAVDGCTPQNTLQHTGHSSIYTALLHCCVLMDATVSRSELSVAVTCAVPL